MIEQQFPTRSGGQVVHERWPLDVAAAARAAGITLERMTREATDMAAHFPRWLLVLVRDGQPVACKCDGLYVFDRGVRCVLCHKAPKETRPARAGWFGVLPPIGIDGLPSVKTAVVKKPPRRHVVGARDGIGTFMLVPLVVQYPAAPQYPLDVYYLPEFRDIPGVPRDDYSHAFHMIGPGRMCLFAPGEWRDDMACREVLQQRAYPHVIKFLNYANGKKDAFAIVTR